MSNNAAKRARIATLFAQQNGLCPWCKLPMILADGKKPSRISATLDHLTESNGKYRPAVAAHQGCNASRQHGPMPSPQTLGKVRKALEAHQKNWSKKKKQQERLAS